MKRTIILTTCLTLLHASLAQAQPQHLRWNIELSKAPTCWDDGQDPGCTNSNYSIGGFGSGGLYEIAGMRLLLPERTLITDIAGVGGYSPTNFWESVYSAQIHVWSNADAFAQSPTNGDVYNQVDVTLLPDPPPVFPGSVAATGFDNYYTTFSFDPFHLGGSGGPQEYIIALKVITGWQFYWSESDVPLSTGSDIVAVNDFPGQWFEVYFPPNWPTGTVAFDVLGCPETPADLAPDCYVDLDDFAIFAGCMAGPDVTTPPPGCDPADFAAADLEGLDNDVDMRDFAAFQTAFTGPAP